MERSHVIALAVMVGAGAAYLHGKGPSHLPSDPVPVAGGGEVSLANCSTEKCLTVMVAPWCPACRRSEGSIKAVRDHLNARGIHARVVVTLDKAEKVREYAQTYGDSAVVDVDGRLHPPNVPHIYVTDRAGKIVNDIGGWPMTDNPALAAQALGL